MRHFEGIPIDASRQERPAKNGMARRKRESLTHPAPTQIRIRSKAWIESRDWRPSQEGARVEVGEPRSGRRLERFDVFDIENTVVIPQITESTPLTHSRWPPSSTSVLTATYFQLP